MLSSYRLRLTATLAAVALAASACGEGESLPTTLDVAASDADLAAIEAAFETPQVESFAGLGYLMDGALSAAGGAVIRLPMEMLRDGPEQPLAYHKERVIQMMEDGTTASAIPLSALGKTFEWNTTTDQYEPTDRTGAPANGVRFIVYQLDGSGYMPLEPLVEVGYAEFTRGTNTGTVAVYSVGGTQIMEYTATVSGTPNAPAFSVEGFIGAGANQVTFNLAFGVSVLNSTITATWRVEVPARGLATRVQIAIGQSNVTIGALMRAGVRRVEMAGTLGSSGGTIVVRIGGRVFANITIDQFDGVTITNRDGGPLTAEEEATLERIFEFFEGAFEAPDALLAPLYTLLDVDLS